VTAASPPKTKLPKTKLLGLQARTKLWAALQAVRDGARPPTTAVLIEAAACERTSALDWLHGWAEAGAVERIVSRKNAVCTYRWRPILRAPAPPDDAPETARQRMWRTAKMLKTFTLTDLALHASVPGGDVPVGSARIYVQFLAAAGYLAVVTPAKRDRAAHVTTTYRFVRSTGPLAPQVIRPVAVWDPNERQVVWRQPDAEAAGRA